MSSARASAKAGLRFLCHNHGCGLTPVDGQIPLRLLIERIDPRYVGLEMDFYWTTAGGADPVEMLDAYPGRHRLIHLQDMKQRVRFEGDGGTPAQWVKLFPYMADAGEGVLDIPTIVAHAKRAGVELSSSSTIRRLIRWRRCVPFPFPVDPLAPARRVADHWITTARRSAGATTAPLRELPRLPRDAEPREDAARGPSRPAATRGRGLAAPIAWCQGRVRPIPSPSGLLVFAHRPRLLQPELGAYFNGTDDFGEVSTMQRRWRFGLWLASMLSVASLGAAGAGAGGSVGGDARLADAVQRRDRQAVLSLLKKRADVNAPQSDGATALHWAAYLEDADTTALLIRAGAKVDTPNNYGVTPLALACRQTATPPSSISC